MSLFRILFFVCILMQNGYSAEPPHDSSSARHLAAAETTERALASLPPLSALGGARLPSTTPHALAIRGKRGRDGDPLLKLPHEARDQRGCDRRRRFTRSQGADSEEDEDGSPDTNSGGSGAESLGSDGEDSPGAVSLASHTRLAQLGITAGGARHRPRIAAEDDNEGSRYTSDDDDEEEEEEEEEEEGRSSRRRRGMRSSAAHASAARRRYRLRAGSRRLIAAAAEDDDDDDDDFGGLAQPGISDDEEEEEEEEEEEGRLTPPTAASVSSAAALGATTDETLVASAKSSDDVDFTETRMVTVTIDGKEIKEEAHIIYVVDFETSYVGGSFSKTHTIVQVGGCLIYFFKSGRKPHCQRLVSRYCRPYGTFAPAHFARIAAKLGLTPEQLAEKPLFHEDLPHFVGILTGVHKVACWTGADAGFYRATMAEAERLFGAAVPEIPAEADAKMRGASDWMRRYMEVTAGNKKYRTPKRHTLIARRRAEREARKARAEARRAALAAEEAAKEKARQEASSAATVPAAVAADEGDDLTPPPSLPRSQPHRESRPPAGAFVGMTAPASQGRGRKKGGIGLGVAAARAGIKTWEDVFGSRLTRPDSLAGLGGELRWHSADADAAATAAIIAGLGYNPFV